MRLVCASALLVLLAASPATAVRRDPWRALRRPLHLPAVAPGAACPTSPVLHAESVAPPFGGYVLGRGPVYAGAIPSDGVVRIDPARADAGGWIGFKVLWIVRPRYRGRVLARGRRLDAPGIIRFQTGAEGRLHHWGTAQGAPGWGHIPSTEWVRSAGCYAFQLDGARFSRVLVFRVAAATP